MQERERASQTNTLRMYATVRIMFSLRHLSHSSLASALQQWIRHVFGRAAKEYAGQLGHVSSTQHPKQIISLCLHSLIALRSRSLIYLFLPEPHGHVCLKITAGRRLVCPRSHVWTLDCIVPLGSRQHMRTWRYESNTVYVQCVGSVFRSPYYIFTNF